MSDLSSTVKVSSDLKKHLQMWAGDGIDVTTHATTTRSSCQGAASNTFETLRQTVLACTQCQELAGTRNSVVFGSGNVKSELVFVGEAPGYDEDRQGLPFVGKAGQLLTRMIEAMGLKREEVYIANVLKCRPPKNRTPLPDEIGRCRPFLLQQLEFIQPRVICALGAVAAQSLLETTRSISSLRGGFHSFKGIKLLATYHPAYLLRNPSEKRKVWEDLKMIKRELGL